MRNGLVLQCTLTNDSAEKKGLFKTFCQKMSQEEKISGAQLQDFERLGRSGQTRCSLGG